MQGALNDGRIRCSRSLANLRVAHVAGNNGSAQVSHPLASSAWPTSVWFSERDDGGGGGAVTRPKNRNKNCCRVSIDPDSQTSS